MGFADLPPCAAWRHVEAREGFETVFFSATARGGWRFVGQSVAVEDGVAWAVRYAIDVDPGWATRYAQVWGRSAAGGARLVRLDSVGKGRWLVDDAPAPDLDGCVDVDLEASACTNTLPVHRLGLAVERLDQSYRRVADDGPLACFDYEAPVFGVACRLVYDESGLVVDYPGLATRVTAGPAGPAGTGAGPAG